MKWGIHRTGMALLLWCCAFSIASQGQAVHTAQLTLSLTVQSSIGLVFQTNPASPAAGFCPLSNSGTNNVGLDLGAASFPTGDNLACVKFTTAGVSYVVSSAFDLVVSKANSSSPSYSLQAQISTAPPAGVSWSITAGGTTTLTTALTPLAGQNANTYGTVVTQTLKVAVNQNLTAQTLAETINFLATAN